MVIELRGRKYGIKRLSLGVRWLRVWSEPHSPVAAPGLCFLIGVLAGWLPEPLLFGTQMHGPVWLMLLIPAAFGIVAAVVLSPSKRYVSKLVKKGCLVIA